MALAWVLWEWKELVLSGKGISTEWTIHGTYKTSKECFDAQMRVWQILDKQARQILQEVKSVCPSIVTTITKTGMSYTRTLRCLPDTIDPRGTKK